MSDQQSSDSAQSSASPAPADSHAQLAARPRQVMSGLHAGYTLTAAVLIGLAAGYGIDRWLDSMPWGMVGGAAFFILAGLYQVVKEHSR